MSTCITANTQAVACLRTASATLEKEHAALLDGWSSRQLASLAVDLASMDLTPAALASSWHALSTALPGADRLTGPAREQFALATTAMEALSADPAGGRLARTNAVLSGALTSATSLVSGWEQAVAADAAALVLPSLGYFVERFDTAHMTSFEARRDDETLLVTVAPGGAVETDHVGLVGDECHGRQSQFAQAMAAAGVELVESARSPHNDPRGGSSVVAAARERVGTLAEGAALRAEREYLLARSAAGQSRRSRRVIDGGAR